MSALEHRYLEFLFLAYSAVWLMAIGFLYRMHRKVRRLEQDLIMMQDHGNVDDSLARASRRESHVHTPSV